MEAKDEGRREGREERWGMEERVERGWDGRKQKGEGEERKEGIGRRRMELRSLNAASKHLFSYKPVS